MCLNIILHIIFLDKYRSMKKDFFYSAKRLSLFLHWKIKLWRHSLYTSCDLYALVQKQLITSESYNHSIVIILQIYVQIFVQMM